MEPILELLLYLIGLIISIFIYDKSLISEIKKIKNLNKIDYENSLETVKNLAFFKSFLFLLFWVLIIYKI